MRLKQSFQKVFIAILLMGLATLTNAQTVKTVGATGADYSTLKGAFDAINAGTLTGSITLQVIANTTETTTAVLNATATGTANYTAVNIYPTVTGLTITGNIAGPMIRLNGASNVTIDGSVNGLGAATDMVISNTSTSTSTTAGTSAIQLYGDATYNTIKYSNIQGSGNGSSFNGIIMFLGVGAGTGNNNNTISNNNISSAGGNRAGVAIYALGVVGDIVTNNTVTNNNIFNFISPTKNSYGVYLDAYTSAWTISNNSLYETTTFTPTTGSLYYMIHVSSQAIGSSFVISGNFIGGSAPNAGGTPLTKSAQTNTFAGIYFSALNGGIASNIQGNIISNLNWINATNASTSYGIFIGSGPVNIGTTSRNTIGSSTGNGAISFTTSYANTYAIFHGISIGSGVGSTSPINIQNNIIGSITASSTTGGVSVFGIYQNCAACYSNVSNNTVGSTTSINSITASSTSTLYANDLVGIFEGTSANGNNTMSSNTIANLTNNFSVNSGYVLNGIQVNTGTNSITSNTIRDLTANNINASTTTTASVSGINIVYSYLLNIIDNKIYNLSNTSPAFNGAVNGILMSSNSTYAHQFKNNFIYGLSVNANATNARIYGINSLYGSSTFANNVISISANIPASVYGIYEQSTAYNNFYFNTVSIAGQSSSLSNNSYAYYGNVGNQPRNIYNNIFYNSKSNSGTATGKHYCIFLNYASTTTVNLASNDYYAVVASGGVMAGTSANATISQLPILVNNDAGSYSIDPAFPSGTGLLATDYIATANQLAGNANGTGILTDYNGTARNVANTSIGAFDYTVVGNVLINATAGTSSLTYSSLKSAFDAINAGIHQGVISIKLNGSTSETASAILNASGTIGTAGTYTGTASYISVTIYPTVTGVSISGSIAAPLIDLNGADNVVIDGRVNLIGSTKSLNIVNYSNSNAATTSTIRWINDASNNTIQYAIIKGAVQGTTTNANGVLFFANGTTTGNINNTIANNDITGLTASIRPNFIISSKSTISNVFNKNNQITNNSIFDFFNPAGISYGINLGTNSDFYTITGNSFYETTNFIPSSTSYNYSFITVNSLMTNATISNNYFGGSSSNAQGMFTKSGSNNIFYGIYFISSNPATGNPNISIQNNTFKNINYTNTSAANFYTIYISANGANISNNSIGSSTGNDAIVFKNGASSGAFYGLYLTTGAGVSKADNNSIAGIKVDNTDAASATNFYGINAYSSGILNVTNNIIGSATVSNSIITNSQSTGYAAGQQLMGINVPLGGNPTTNVIGNTICNLTNNAQGGVVTKTDQIIGIYLGSYNVYVSGNTIYNLSAATLNNTNYNVSGNTAAITGISEYCNTPNANGLHDINKNTIYNLIATNPQFIGVINGISSYINYQTGNTRFNSNFIYNLKLDPGSVGASVYGINFFNAYNTYTYNNIITIGEDIPANYYGIAINENAYGYRYEFFNTVNIKGNPSAGSYNSFAFYANNNVTTYANSHVIKNNIFTNNRSNTNTANGNHYAAYYNYELTNSGLMTQDYNNYYVTGTGGVLAGVYSGTVRQVNQLPIFSSPYDINSTSVDPLFNNVGGATPASFIPASTSLTAVNLSIANSNLATNDTYSTDFSGKARNIYASSMGAYEVPSGTRITVNATVGVLSRSYNTLYDAFLAINKGTHQGVINIYLNGSTVETNTCNLYSSGYQNALYSSINILPKAPNLSITGNIAGALIQFYGAKGVILDGRVNGTGTLTSTCLVVSNTSTATNAASFYFAADASNNIIRYNTIKGAGSTINTGVLFFNYSGSTKTGITNNIIDHNNITSVSNNARPVNAIYSLGGPSYYTTNLTISNNNFYNFLNPDNNSNGIFLQNYHDNCTIKDNSFYETTNFSPTAIAGSYNAIINLGTGSTKNNFTVTGNYIGGTAPLAGGSPWVKTSSNDNIFYAIYLNGGTAGFPGNIHANNITNFDYSNNGNAPFYGIYQVGGTFNIGTKGGNVIGATAGNNSIIYKAGTNNGNFYGMYLQGTNPLNIQNNTIGSIKTDNADQSLATHFYGIYRINGYLNMKNNTIGTKDANTANSIDLASASTANGQLAYGVYMAATVGITPQGVISNNTIAKIRNQNSQATSATGVVNGISLNLYNSNQAVSANVSNNIISDLTIANSNQYNDNRASVIGINNNNYYSLAPLVTQTISNNTIYNLSNTSSDFSGSVIGLYLSGPNSKNIANANFVYGLSAPGASSVAANLYAAKIDKGSFRITNNLFSLGGDTKSNLYGLYVSSGTLMDTYVYYNTILISGSVASGTNSSTAIYIADKTSVRDIRNNIFNNIRSTTGGNNLHFAYYMPSVTGIGTFTSNYNNFIASGTGGKLGYYNGSAVTATNITGVDANSISISPGFGTDLTLKSSYVSTASMPAVSLTDVPFDFNDNNRNVSTPLIGAIEGGVASNTVSVYNGSNLLASYVNLKFAFDAINAGTHTGTIIIKLTASQTLPNSAVLNESGIGSTNYSSITIYPTVDGVKIAGNMPKPLIHLIGADNVTIDGRVNGQGNAKSLEINNQSVASDNGTSTVKIENDASNFTLQYSILKGSTTSLYEGIFSIGNSASSGNDQINILNNSFTNAYNDVTKSPYNSIYIQATVSGNENDHILIDNNLFFDNINLFTYNANNVINVQNYNAYVTVSNNSIYKPSSVQGTVGNSIYGIFLSNVVSSSVLNNYIGGTAPRAGGTPFLLDANYNYPFVGIYLNTYGTLPSQVQGNVITNFDFRYATTFTGITLNGSAPINVGDISPNIIGASTGNSSILFKTYSPNSYFYGISVGNNAPCLIKNNIIGSVNCSSTNSLYNTNAYGIYITTPGIYTLKVINNTIGSIDGATINSFASTSSSTSYAQNVRGIFSTSNNPVLITGNTIAKLYNGGTGSSNHTINGIYVAGSSTINDNTISDLTSSSDANIEATTASPIAGIVQSTSTTGYASSIQGNKVYNLYNTGATTAAVNLNGIYFYGTSTLTNTIAKNYIYAIQPNASSTATNVNGIKIAAGLTNYVNNIINIGGDFKSNYTGIYETGAVGHDNKFYFNTINLYGTVNGGTNSSTALYSAVNTNVKEFKNNIFVNTRSTTGGTNLHYALYVPSATNTITSDYNNYYVSGTGSVLGYFGTNVNTSNLITGNDVNSVSVNPIFSTGNINTVYNFYPTNRVVATPVANVIADYFNTYRSSTIPVVGAIESNTISNTIDVYVSNVLQASYPLLNNAFDAINAGTHTGTIDVKIKANSILTSSAILNASGTGNASYASIKIYPITSNISIIGNIDVPLIDLNGADNVTFDGRINANNSLTTNDLTFINQSNSTGADVSTIRFSNSAENNVLSYLTIKGASANISGFSANVYFSNSASGNGNDNNTIDHCNLTGISATSKPLTVISTSGGTATIFDNGNTISNNSIFDYYANNSIYVRGGVYLTGYSTNFKILNNSFYETQVLTPSISTNKYYGVYISSSNTNVYHTIQGNYFGGTSIQAGGSAMTFSPTTNIAYQVFPIYVNSQASTNPNSIQGNVIKNFRLNNNISASNPFVGISVLAGLANIGTITGNTIGSITGAGSIMVTDYYNSTSGSVVGINATSAYALNIMNNNIGSISTDGANITGIYVGNGYGNTNVSNNLIGSIDDATTSSLTLLNPSIPLTKSLSGISVFGQGINTINNNTVSKLSINIATGNNALIGIYGYNGTQLVTNNIIRDLSNLSTNNTYSNYGFSNGNPVGTEYAPAISGIYIQPTTINSQNSISNNKVYNLYRPVVQSSTNYIRGIFFTNVNCNVNVNANFVNNIINGSSNTGAAIYGIGQYNGYGQINFFNNVISLGGDFPSNSMYGVSFWAGEGNKLNAFYNTINLYGKSSIATSYDYAMYAPIPASTLKNIQNNLFINTRTSTSTTSTVYHYGLYLSDNMPQNALILNNNNYYLGTGYGRALGYNSFALSTVPLINGLDVNSVSISPNFSNPTGNNPYEYKIGSLLNGVTVPATNVDYYSITRGSIPNMGAFDKLSIPQTITFNSLSNKTFGDANFQLTALGGSSGNPVTYTSSDTTIVKCTGTNGSIVTILKAGTVSITANQLGNAVYSAANPVTQNLIINKANQTISLSPLPIGNVSLKDFIGNIPVIATASSGLSVTVSLANTSAASLNASNELYNIGSSGTVIINLFQAGNSNYNAAVASYRFDVVKANQAITFNNIADRTYAGSPITISTSGLARSDANLAISYTIQSGPATITANTITITGAGIVRITASQAGDAQRNAAESVTQTINVFKGSQTINFSSLVNKSYGDAPFTISATGGNGNFPVTFTSSDPNIATCTGPNGSLVTILQAGTVSITASQPGDINFNDAIPVSQSLIINKIDQTLSLDPLPINGSTISDFGIPIQLSGSSTSGLPVAFSLGNTTTADINSDNQLENVDTTGNIIIVVSQEGNANYNPATVSYTFNVKKANQNISFNPLNDVTYSDGLTLNLTATTSSGLPVAYSVVSGPATINNSILTLTGPGTVVINASQAGNGNYNTAGDVQQTLNVNPKLTQGLNFGTIPDQIIRSGTFTFTITSTPGESGNPVIYTSSDPSIATISGSNTATVTVYKKGYVQITASQAANSNYAAASMTQSFNITKPILTITANSVTKNFGETLSNNNYTNYTVTGLSVNEIIGNVSVNFTNAAPANALPNTYFGDIVISNASGGTFNPNNYDIVYVNGDVTVNPVTPTYLTYPRVSFSTGNFTSVTPSTDASLPYTSMSISPALPSGLALDATTGIISGTPVGTSSSTYTVTLNNALGSITGTIIISVTSIPPAPIITYSNISNVFTQGVDIGTVSPSITNPVSSLTISPALPSGLTFNTSTGQITGTSSVTSVNTIYTITAINAGGTGTATISIQVNAAPPPAPIISYASSFNVFTVGTAISTITPTLTGIANSWSISPSLPTGLIFNTSNGNITGTPSAPIANSLYTISATNITGTGTSIIAIQVDTVYVPPVIPVAPTISYTSNTNVFTVGTAISAISATVSGTVTGWSITPSLPAGLTFNTSTGAITGTPSVAISNTTYTITATNNGSDGTATITIQVNPAPPVIPIAPTISYTSNTNVFTVGTAITTISATVSGTVTGWAINPSLPAGLTFNTSTGAITGTPSVAISNTTYTITATNNGSNGTATITIQVNPAPPVIPVAPTISYTSNTNVFTVGTAISTISATVSGTVTGWSINPSLPAGLTFNTSTGAITGTPSVTISNTTYTITATNNGSNGTATITIQINAAVQSPTNPPVTPPVVIPDVRPITGINLICGKYNTTQLNSTTIGGVWTSSKPSVASVSNSGLVTGIGNQNDTLTITYTVTVNGVSNYANYLIKYVANPVPGINMTPVDLVSNTSTRINARDFGATYEWSTDAFNNAVLSSVYIQSPYATINSPAKFKIKITDNYGCVTIDTLEARLFFEKKIYLPNTFTPNGDGINDVFKLNPVGIRQLIYFSVYNTRGVKLFETNNINDSWDGKYNGVMQPMASYPWVLSAIDESGKQIKETGTITLLR